MHLLNNTVSLRKLRYDIEPPLAASILASCATKRNDPDYIREHRDDWLQLLPLSKSINEFARHLIHALSLGVQESWAIEGFGNLAGVAREQKDVTAGTWEELLSACLETGETTFPDLFEKAVENLAPQADGARVLAPWLNVLSRAPASAREWALKRADELLMPLENDPAGREIAPSICLFYARMSREDRVREWLERATDERAPVWRDRIHLALLSWEVEQGETGRARERLENMKTEGTKDAARETMAKALARSSPSEAGRDLASIADKVRRALLAAELSGIPEFTGTLENTYHLLLALEENPDALAKLLRELAISHPDSDLVREFARQTVSGSTNLAEAVSEALHHDSVIDLVGRKRIEKLAHAILGDDKAPEEIIMIGVIEKLLSTGLIKKEEASDLKAELGIEE